MEDFSFERAMLTDFKGRIEVFIGDSLKEAKIGMYLTPSDTIITKDGSMVDLLLDSGSSIRILGDSHIKLKSLFKKNSFWTTFKIELGKWWSRLIGKPRIELGTPGGSAAPRGTEFTVEVSDNKTTVLTVLEGVVEFSDLEYNKNVSVGQYQTSTVESGGVPSDPQSIDLSQIDRWWEEKQEVEEKGIPGFEAISVIVALAIVFIILRRKK